MDTLTTHNGTGTLVDLLRWRARHQADQFAYTFLKDGEPEAALTYGELDRRARALASVLQRAGLQDQRALLLYPSSADFIVAFFGCLYARVLAVPAYPPRPNRGLERVAAIAADADVSVILSSSGTLDKIRDQLDDILTLKTVQRIATDCTDVTCAESWLDPGLTGETLAHLQYTSGSTSTPKGAVISHANLVANLADIDEGLKHDPGSVMVTWLPIFHDMGLIYGILQPLFNGIPCYVISPMAFLQQPICWLRAISRYRGTHTAAPNFAYELCVRKTTPEQREGLDLSCWKMALNGAEPVRAETMRRFAEMFGPYGLSAGTLTPGYGLAEATLKISGTNVPNGPKFLRLDSNALKRDRVTTAEQDAPGTQLVTSCGTNSGSTHVIIANPETMRQCAPGQVGEIWAKGPGIAKGYWRKPEETRHTFEAYLTDNGDGPFMRTGDLGFFHEGELYVTGRLKDMIIVAGRNHYPQDIEPTVGQCHPALRDGGGAAFSIDVDGEERVVIVQELERSHLRKPNTAEIFAQIRRSVSEQHEIQVHAIALIKTGTLPKTSSGKTQRRGCRELFLKGELDMVASWRSEIANREGSSEPQPVPADSQAATAKKMPTASEIAAWLTDRFARLLNTPPEEIDQHQILSYYGVGSIDAVGIAGELAEFVGRPLAPTLLWEHPSIHSLAQHLQAEPASQQSEGKTGSVAREPIAIIGMSCRFPGAESPEEFWDVLVNGRDVITDVPPDRWDVEHNYDSNPETPGKSYARRGGFLKGIDRFDAQFFGISPREAASTDPQQRIFLEVTWEALERAGIAPEKLAGSDTGVFVGMTTFDYQLMQIRSIDQANLNPYHFTGGADTFVSGRISYWLDLHGPSMSVDTACSSSLVSVHLACQSIWSGECKLAIAGGVNLILAPEWYVVLCKARMLSADGRCKVFDKSADGYVRGEGCGAVILKPLSAALADGDNVLAVIRGTAINHGGRASGITVPTLGSQQAVMRKALEQAQLPASRVTYVEAHGTGTSLGDPIEMKALLGVMNEGRGSEPLVIGSVKTNIGHLEPAAGVASLIKVVLSLQNGEIPPHLHLNEMNPEISLDGAPVTFPAQRMAWPNKGSRIAAINSFGASGTNAHLVVEEAPPHRAKAAAPRAVHLLPLSAKNEESLKQVADRFWRHLSSSATAIEDVCTTAATGRAQFPSRLAVVARSGEEMAQKLRAFAQSELADGVFSGRAQGVSQPKVAFVFTGQGSQYVGMGRGLYDSQPVFKAAIDECDAVLRPLLGTPLLSVLYPEAGEGTPIDETAYTQPALFALEYALAKLLQSLGLQPAAVLGHSVGEYVAACIAGVFTLPDGLRLIAERGRLMQALPAGGAMVAVLGPQDKVLQALRGHSTVSVAAFNGPESVTISGPATDVQAMADRLTAEGLRCRSLNVSHAFHSGLMDPMLKPFRDVANGIRFAPATLDLFSNLTGTRAGTEIQTAEYWVRHVREPVRFAEGMQALHASGCSILLEVGPSPTLLGMAKRFLPEKGVTYLPSLRSGQDDQEAFLRAVAALHCLGTNIDWEKLQPAGTRRRVVLPTYPFQKKRYWFEAASLPQNAGVAQLSNGSGVAANGADASHEGVASALGPLLGKRLPSPLEQAQFETSLSTAVQSYLADFAIEGMNGVNIGVYVEMALAAAAQVHGPEVVCSIEGLNIRQALVLEEGKATKVQLVLSNATENTNSFQLFSYPTEQSGTDTMWPLHASGTLRLEQPRTPPAFSVGEVQARNKEKLSGAEFYRRMWKRKVYLGPAGQWHDEIWRRDGEALSLIRPPRAEEADAFRSVHPGLIDACFQLMYAAAPGVLPPSAIYMLLGLEQFSVHQCGVIPRWCHTKLRSQGEDALTGDIALYGEDGSLILSVSGAYMRRVTRESIMQALQAPSVPPMRRTAPPGGGGSALQAELRSLDQEGREARLASHVAVQVAAVLGLSASDVDIDESLPALGLDSLLALDLSHRLEADLGASFPIVLFIETPSIRSLIPQLLSAMPNMAATQSRLARIDEKQLSDVTNRADWVEGEL